MSRNLARTDCLFCSGDVKIVGAQRPVTRDDCGVYYNEYAGMIVADAECVDCKAKYLAWVNRSCIFMREVPEGQPFGDLCYVAETADRYSA